MKIFSKDFPDKNIGSSSIRSSYYSWISTLALENGTPLTYETKEIIANKMRTSVEQLDKNYLKIYKFSYPKNQQEQVQAPIIPQQPMINTLPKTNTYFKKLEKNKEYIKNNKDKVYQKQKEYRKTIPKEDATRKRLLRLLNNDNEYKNHIKKSTVDKYNFQIDSSNRYY